MGDPSQKPDRISPEDAESLVRRMRDQALVELDSAASPVQLTDREYEQVQERLGLKIAEALAPVLGLEV